MIEHKPTIETIIQTNLEQMSFNTPSYLSIFQTTEQINLN